MNGEVALPKEWVKTVGTWGLIVVVSAFSGGVVNDGYYGARGRNLEAKVIHMEVLLNELVKQMEDHDEFIEQAPRSKDLQAIQARVKNLEKLTQELLLEVRIHFNKQVMNSA